MSVNLGNCLKNLTLCRPGEHCLYRGYGVNAVDSPYGLSYGDVKSQCSAYYPDVDNIEITKRSTSNDYELGTYRYTISIKGVNGNV